MPNADQSPGVAAFEGAPAAHGADDAGEQPRTDRGREQEHRRSARREEAQPEGQGVDGELDGLGDGCHRHTLGKAIQGVGRTPSAMVTGSVAPSAHTERAKDSRGRQGVGGETAG
jgi:hypothetical protein